MYPGSQFLDYGYTGYKSGTMEPPDLLSTAYNFKDTFGAKGDGVTDDTAAFQLAANWLLPGNAIYLPAGTYILNSSVTFVGLTMIGDGPSETVILLNSTLADSNGGLVGAGRYGRSAMLLFNGAGDWLDITRPTATVTTDAALGDTRIYVTSSDGIVVGGRYRVVISDSRCSAVRDVIYQGTRSSNWMCGSPGLMRWPVTVVGKGVGYIDLESPLPFPAATRYNAQIHETFPELPSGLDSLSVAFRESTYVSGRESRNAVLFEQIGDSYLRNVIITNADTAVSLRQVASTSLINVAFTSTGPRAARYKAGFRGLTLERCHSVSVRGLVFSSTSYRDSDISVSGGAMLAFSGIRGPDVKLSTLGPYGLLLSDWDVGLATRFGLLSGNNAAGAYATVWNVRSSRRDPLRPASASFPPALVASNAVQVPSSLWSPLVNWVSTNVNGWMPVKRTWLVEQQSSTAGGVYPRDVHAALVQSTVRPPGPPSWVQSVNYGGYSCWNGTRCCHDDSCSNPCPENAPTSSTVYGCSGELLDLSGRLSDWTWSGPYGQGAAAVPNFTTVINVRALGARGDGTTDDTAAFLRAIDRANPRTVLYVPAGTYVITSVLSFDIPLVLRGAGRDLTKLYFPKSLGQMENFNFSSSTGSTPYTFGGGVIQCRAFDSTGPFSRVARVVAPATKGSVIVRVDSSSRIRKGAWIRVIQSDVNGRLISQLAGTTVSGSIPYANLPYMARLITPVVAVGAGWIQLQQPLHFDIALGNRPEIHIYNPVLVNCGVEDVTIEFPLVPYGGHWRERGYNAIYFHQADNSWVRRVRMVNVDTGIVLWGSFNLVEDVEFVTGFRGLKYDGHFGITVSFGNFNLIQGFNISARFFHDISISGWASGNVVRDGWAMDMTPDHHRGVPYCNLWTNIYAGKGARGYWMGNGGNRDQGPASGIHATFWNIRFEKNVLTPGPDLGTNQAFVAASNYDWAPPQGTEGWLMEKMNAVYPPDLYASLLRRKRGRTAPDFPYGLA